MSDKMEVIRELDVFGMKADNHTVINRCIKLSEVHQKTIEEVVEELMGIVLDKAPFDTREEITVVTSEMIDKLEADGFKKVEKKPVVVQPVKQFKSPSPQKKIIDTREKKTQMFSPTTFSPGTPSIKYSGRQNKGNVAATFNCEATDEWKSLPNTKVIVANVNNESLLKPVPFLYANVGEKIAVLDHRLNVLGEDINILSEEKNEEQTITVGRIVSAGEVKLGPTTVMLEGSVGYDRGKTSQLDLSKLQSPVSLFPGQIVKVESHEAKGDRIVAKRIFTQAELPSSPAIPHANPLRVIVASGPFSPYDSLTYEPLMDLLKESNKCKPDVLILMGPFIDESHPHISEMDESFDSAFQRLLQDISITIPDVTVIIQTCVRDVHQLPVYPTPPLNIRSLPNNFHLVPDPCLISINDIVFGITATDVIHHMLKQEFATNQHPNDRLHRLASHLLQQKTFYPLFPPECDHPLDLEMWEDYCQLSVKPSVLILPSDMRCFVKNIDDCVVVNPEHLCKVAGGGTYAKIDILPTEGHSLTPNNVKVAIVRI